MILGTFIAALLAACARQDSTDYCDSHYLYHESHVENVASLDISHSEDGRVATTFSLPKSLIGRRRESAVLSEDQIVELLNDPGKVFTIQSESDCTVAHGDVTIDNLNIFARYQMDCGAGMKIGQIDIPLFDVLPEIDEIVVQVTTPATGKHFAISRQCDNAIFRLQTRSNP